MAFTANGTLIDNATAHAPSSTAKSALVTDLKAFQTELATQTAVWPNDAEPLGLQEILLELARKTADSLKDHVD